MLFALNQIKRIVNGFSTTFDKYRYYSSDLKEIIRQKIPVELSRLQQIRSQYGTYIVDKITVNKVMGGMRGMTGLLWETSSLDAAQGIRFREYSIPELQQKLPSAVTGGQPLPEGLLWLLMTGDLPTKQQVENISIDLQMRRKPPDQILKVIRNLPSGTHPMTQFSIGVLSLQNTSNFALQYYNGLHKNGYWEPIYEDTMDLIANLPLLAAAVYRNAYFNGDIITPDDKLDWAANLVHMMGYDSQGAMELMRMYQTIHADHEGGNVSAHTCHAAGSTLSDPYLSYSAGLSGLAGPLHGLANQEVLKFLKQLQKTIGQSPTKEEIQSYVRKVLADGKLIPGYGHAVLRVTDPRYTCQQQFAAQYLPEDDLYRLVRNLYEVVPPLLLETGKVKNPWPNVDAHSGVLLQHFGIVQEDFFTVLFGVSRGIGVLAQGVWSRALRLPIEYLKSITMDQIEQKLSKR
eukprot:TRINITY_DN5547_c0_g2_i1.p1 TRINITY_DN5547_c0_g2~~TRINITY_DN5547_c0_g2_i1.p1  ORF type:complete len:460 (+),score=67.90 TRINITY_DN5547_c0_g2_i1:70-1449(+)